MNGCGVAVVDPIGDVKAVKTLDINRGQAEHLIPMVEDILKQTGITPERLQLIAVTHGPGAFTGLRIGIAAAKAFGLALDIPAVGVCTFQAVAKTAQKQHPEVMDQHNLCILLETKRKDFYVEFRQNATWSKKQTISDESLAEHLGGSQGQWYVIGDAYDRFMKAADANHKIKTPFKNRLHTIKVSMPDPMIIAELGRAEYEKTKKNDKQKIKVSPVYLRPPEIGIPKTKIRKIAQK